MKKSFQYYAFCGLFTILFIGILKVLVVSNNLYAFSHSLDLHGNEDEIKKIAEQRMREDSALRREAKEREERKADEEKKRQEKEAREKRDREEKDRRAAEEKKAFEEHKNDETRRAAERMKQQEADAIKRFG